MVAPSARPAPHKYIVVKKFKTLNSQPARNALKPEEFSWIENFMPIGNGFVPMVPGPDTAIATLASGGGGSTATALFLNHWNGTEAYHDEIAGVSWLHTTGSAPIQNGSDPMFGAASLVYSSAGSVRSSGFDPLDAESFTVEGFANPDTGGVAGLQLSSSTTSAQVGANIDEGSNFVQLFVLNAAGSTVYNEVASISISAGVYKHLAIVYDNGNGTVTGYYDGTQYLQVTGISTAGYSLDQGDVGYTGGGRWDETRLMDGAIYAGATLTVPTGEFSP